jgi:hypothetical protein
MGGVTKPQWGRSSSRGNNGVGMTEPRVGFRVRRGCISSRRHFKTSPSTSSRVRVRHAAV